MLKATFALLMVLTVSLFCTVESEPAAAWVPAPGSTIDPQTGLQTRLDAQAKRFGFAPQGRRDFIGFRVVMKIP